MTLEINKDKFLQRQGIEVQGSDFLKKSLEKKVRGIKEEYNVRDLHGLRLSRHWSQGDTIWTVSKKIMKQRFINTLDPDTYTKESFREIKEEVVKQKVKIFGILLTLALPLTFYLNFVRPRINRIKRLYYMQFYNKMGFFSKELGVKTKEVSQKDLQKQL